MNCSLRPVSRNGSQGIAFEESGRERIRTSEGVRQQIYSLPPLSTWVHARDVDDLNRLPPVGESHCSETLAWVHALIP